MTYFDDMIEFAKMPTGRVQYDVFHCGELIERVDKSNLIVAKAKTILAHLMAGTAGYPITKIGFGTNGTPPALGNTTLTSAFVKDLGTATFPATTQVSFPFTLEDDEANGSDVSEIGLLTTSGLLFARLTRLTPLAKTSEIVLTGNWIITF